MHEPTMADIAARVGVSRQLVSLVLRDLPGASEETRVRVRRAAQDLGYRPHLGARTLRQSRSSHLGVVFAPADASRLAVVEALYVAAAERGFGVVLSATTRTRSTREAVDELLGHRCAAVIVIGSQLSSPNMRVLARRAPVPIVQVGAGERNPVYDVVRSAGAEGVAAVVGHLLDLGHTHLTYVSCQAMPFARQRLDGYQRALSEAGLPVDVLEVRGRDHREDAGAKAGRRLLRRRDLPTAVLTGNDEQAVGLLQVLFRSGVRVPEDVSVAGFGDHRFASVSSVALTTVREDPDHLASAAVAAAVRRVRSPSARPGVRAVRPTLVTRSSTGPPRATG